MDIIVSLIFPPADALHKISALEGELARLKAQIAVYALSESVPPPPPPPPPMAQVQM
jgi:hypothetical protein